MSNFAIAYFSKYGQTSKIAAFLEQRLMAMNHSVQLINVAETGAELGAAVDCVVVGAPVYAGKFPVKLLRWVRERREKISGKRLALFTVSLNAGDARPASRPADLALLRQWIDQAGLVPAHVASLAGALKYPSYSWPVRGVMKRISAEAGGGLDTTREYEYTDWHKVGAFAAAVAHNFEDSDFSTALIFPEHRRMDQWMPTFERSWCTFIDVDQPVGAVDSALRHLHPDEMRLASVLTQLRTFGRAAASPPTEGFLEGAEKFGNVPLEDAPRDELVAGLVGKFWRLDFGIRRLSKSEFARFREPGYAVVVSNFRFQSLGVAKTRVHAEMRIHCTDWASSARFAIYWGLLGPGIRLFMRSALRALKRHAEDPILHPNQAHAGR